MTQNEILIAIEARREELGKSIPVLANDAGISAATYGQWTAGLHSPSIDKILSVIRALGMHIRIEADEDIDRSPCMTCTAKRTCGYRCDARKAYERRREEARRELVSGMAE